MINFTGIIKTGRNYYNTNKIVSWKPFDESNEKYFIKTSKQRFGTDMYLDNEDQVRLHGITAEQLKDAFVEAEKTGFSQLA